MGHVRHKALGPVLLLASLGSCLPEAAGGVGGGNQNLTSSPSGSVLSSEAKLTGTGRYDVTSEVVVLDEDGKSYGGVSGGDVTYESGTDPESGATITWEPGVSCASSKFKNPNSSASIVLIMDQSGSMASTDPWNVRLPAAKAFLGTLASPTDVLLMSFAGNETSPNPCASELVVTYGSFTTDYDSYDSTLDGLEQCVGGNTPLWEACLKGLDAVAQGKNPAKALVVFTDGEASDSAYTLEDVIAKAKQNGTRVFTVGLSEGVNVGVLSNLAQSTGGAFFFAPQVEIAVGAFLGMNMLLNGEYDKHSCAGKLSISGVSSDPVAIQTNVRIQAAGAEIVAPVYIGLQAEVPPP